MHSTKFLFSPDNLGPAIIIINLNQIMAAIIICSAIILSSSCNTYGGNNLHCGDEFRIETREGTTFQGKLLKNMGHSLVFRNYFDTLELSIIPLEDVTTIYHIKSMSRKCAMIGILSGGVAGFAVAVSKEYPSETGLFMSGTELWDGIGITLCGAVIGGVIGGIIGRKIVRCREIQLEALPMCRTKSGVKSFIRIIIAIGS